MKNRDLVMAENSKGGLEKNAVIVFLKAPEQGRVKTRLSLHLPERFVLDLYKGFVLDTLDTLESLKNIGPPFVYYSPPKSGPVLKKWLKKEYAYCPQRGDNLGKRMANAFLEVFNQGVKTAILMGTDIPELTRKIVQTAFEALETRPAVLGPAADGGYYLIGFQKQSFSETVFCHIDWSTDAVLSQTCAAMTRQSLPYELLPELHDIDTPEALAALSNRLKKGGAAGRHTLKNLQSYEA